jgi:hypothetical protein
VSATSRALLVASSAPCYLGAGTTQAIGHLWGLLKRVSHGNLTADGMSGAIFRSIDLWPLWTVLGLGHTQPGREPKSVTALSAVAQID